jgi:hypothetical protein
MDYVGIMGSADLLMNNPFLMLCHILVTIERVVVKEDRIASTRDMG